jgi:hypothetical protein
MTYHSLLRHRRSLIRKIAELREAHKPSDRFAAELQRITTDLLLLELSGEARHAA